MTTMHLRRLLLLLTLLLPTAALTAMAQTEPALTQYFQAPTFYNPAAVGETDYIRLRGGSRLQWVGIDGAPTDFIVTADSPFKFLNRRFGAGVVLFQESIGLYNTMDISAQLAVKQKLFKGMLSGAVQVGYLSQSFKGSEVVIPDGDDFHESSDEGIPMTDVTGSALDLSVGLWYTRSRWWAGVSCTHVNAPVVKLRQDGSESSDEQNYEFQFTRSLYLMGGCNIPIKNTLFEVLPSVMVTTDFGRVQADVTARLRWKKFLTAGLAYRTQDAVSLLLEAQVKGFTLGYSYDYATSAIMRASSGSHEVWVGYSLKLDMGEKNRNSHKSIRVM
jgi:type IX secretion system PorP/SprF family membrane protein